MDENVVVTTFKHISRSIGDGETAVLADLDESGPAPVVRERLRRLVHH